MIKVILFDLDGTLLPMDQDLFLKTYFGGLIQKAASDNAEKAKLLARAIDAGTIAMIKNDGKEANETVFWKEFWQITGDEFTGCEALFDDFYLNEFQSIKNVCGCAPESKEIISLVKSLGYRAVLATNPMFPIIATESRIRWAGLEPEDFELVTTFENSHYGKPNVKYYEEIAQKLGVSTDECLMVGNDARDDMAAADIGMKVFLLTECLINKEERDISAYPSGSYADLIRYIKNID